MVDAKKQRQYNKVAALLRHVGCSDILEALPKIHYLVFIGNLADWYHKYGRLSAKQKLVLIEIIESRTDATCSGTRLGHESLYTCTGQRNGKSITRIDHPYGELTDLGLYDLPYTSGEEVVITVYPYSKISLVTYIEGLPYRIPKPDQWQVITEETKVACIYKRTACKGFLFKKAVEEDTDDDNEE